MVMYFGKNNMKLRYLKWWRNLKSINAESTSDDCGQKIRHELAL